MLEAAALGGMLDGLSELALAARDGSEESAARLWSVARPRLVRIALALGARPDDLPDLVQDVLLAAHPRLRQFDPGRGRFEGWLATMLVHRVRNQRRGLLRRLRFLAGLRPETPKATMDGVDERLTLECLLVRLTPVQREVVALYEIAELPAGEAAQALGMTAAGVSSITRSPDHRISSSIVRSPHHEIARFALFSLSPSPHSPSGACHPA